MRQYLDLLQHILDNGVQKPNRTGVDTISVFGHQMRFDLSEGFPLVTTKKTWFRGIAHELLWMLRGESNIGYLREHKVKIWDEWASENYRPDMGYPDGELGPVYGVQWRRWMSASGEPIDQVEQIVDELRNGGQSRRIILSAWNVGEIDSMKLPPCHCFAQFSVTEGKLSCLSYLRSWDVFLGGPFNIAQYALLIHMLACVAGLEVGELIVASGDTHLYVNHLEQVQTQLARSPLPLPTLTMQPMLQEIDAFCYEDFLLSDYRHHPHIPGEVAV